MQKYAIVSVFWDNNGQPSVSFFSFPINCSQQNEVCIKITIKECNNFQTIENIAKLFLDDETFKVTKQYLDLFRSDIKTHIEMYATFIECPDDADIEKIIADWIESKIGELRVKHHTFSAN